MFATNKKTLEGPYVLANRETELCTALARQTPLFGNTVKFEV